MTAALIKPKWKLTRNRARGARTLGVAMDLLLLKGTTSRSPRVELLWLLLSKVPLLITRARGHEKNAWGGAFSRRPPTWPDDS